MILAMLSMYTERKTFDIAIKRSVLSLCTWPSLITMRIALLVLYLQPCHWFGRFPVTRFQSAHWAVTSSLTTSRQMVVMTSAGAVLPLLLLLPGGCEADEDDEDDDDDGGRK